MKKQTYIIVGGLLVLIVVVLGWKLLGGDGDGTTQTQAVADGEPIDVTLDFYDQWLAAVRSTSTDPYQEGLATDPILSPALRAKLAEAGEGADLVLCETNISPDTNLAARPIGETDSEAQVLVSLRQTGAQQQAAVTLVRQSGGWYIDDIACASGETAPDREYSFDREGYLLKDNIPPPRDSEHWHIVFEQDGQQGYTAPLFFGGESMCRGLDGVETTCNPDDLTEVSKVVVKGEMSEAGVEVKRLELMETE